jgi:predicted kinase
MKKIYIFRGSPASGKGTITAALMSKLEGKVAYIELDKFRWGFHLVNRTVSQVSNEEHALAYRNYLSVLENYLTDGNYTIVTEGLFSWNKPGPHGNMQDILTLCKKHEYEAVPILLHADYDVLWDRNLKRKYSVPKEEFDDLYNTVMGERSESEYKISVGENTVSESVNRCLTL